MKNNCNWKYHYYSFYCCYWK